jgi:F-type H+-transporting ATPase subunit b
MDNPLVQPDPGLFIWTILTFLVLVALLGRFAWRPLLQALEHRQAGIAAALDEAQRARQELERLTRESVQTVAAARAEAEAIVTRSRADAEALREELKQKARRRTPDPARDVARGAADPP